MVPLSAFWLGGHGLINFKMYNSSYMGRLHSQVYKKCSMYFRRLSLYLHYTIWLDHAAYSHLNKYGNVCVATLTLGLQPRQGLAKVQAKSEAWESHFMLRPRSVGECEGMNPHTPKWSPTLGVRVPKDSRIFRGQLYGVKTHGIEKFLIPLEIFWNLNVWNRLARPIWVLKT
jgi:hypothetical protein